MLLVLRALRMQHTATDLRPPPPPWTENPQTLAQLSTHNRIEAMDSGKNSDNDFSMDTKPPQSDIDPGQTKVATKTLLALRAGCPPPPLLLLPLSLIHI